MAFRYTVDEDKSKRPSYSTFEYFLSTDSKSNFNSSNITSRIFLFTMFVSLTVESICIQCSYILYTE